MYQISATEQGRSDAKSVFKNFNTHCAWAFVIISSPEIELEQLKKSESSVDP